MSLQKSKKIRSKQITQSANGESCTLREPGCDWEGTVVFCHLPSQGKGVGTKSSDLFGIYACYRCHQRLDAGKVDAEDMLRGFQETLLRLVDKGLIEIK